MSEYNTKSDMSEKAVIRTFRSNDFGTIFRFPIVGFLPDNIQATTDWFAKELRSSLYKVSCMMPFQTYNGVPRIVIDYKNEDPDNKSRMVILPYDLDGKYHFCIGVDEDGILIQTKMSNLLDKNLFTEVYDRPEDPKINCAAELRDELVEFISSKDEHPSQDDKNAIVFCEEDVLKTLHTIDETLECGGFLHADWPYYAKNAVTQINIAFIPDPKLYVRNVTSEKDLDKNCVKHYVVGELRQRLSADGRKHKIIVYPIYRDSGSIGNVLTLLPTKYVYLRNWNTDVDDVLYDTHIKEV